MAVIIASHGEGSPICKGINDPAFATFVDNFTSWMYVTDAGNMRTVSSQKGWI